MSKRVASINVDILDNGDMLHMTARPNRMINGCCPALYCPVTTLDMYRAEVYCTAHTAECPWCSSHLYLTDHKPYIFIY